MPNLLLIALAILCVHWPRIVCVPVNWPKRPRHGRARRSAARATNDTLAAELWALDVAPIG